MAEPTKDPQPESPAEISFEPMSEADADLQKRKQQAKAERSKRRDREGKGVVNINSLMDAMTIMLVFLLVSITADPLNVKQDASLMLAKSTIDYNPGTDSIPILVTKDHIVVDHQAVVQIECTLDGRACTNIPPAGQSDAQALPEGDIQALNYCDRIPAPRDCTPDVMERLKRIRFRIDKSYKQDGSEEQFLILPLHKKLQQLVRAQKEENLALGRQFKGVTTIVADRSLPFRMLAEIVHTAGMAELGDIRFAVVKSNVR
jgi:hypothetical protein